MMGTPDLRKKEDGSSSGLSPQHVLHVPETRGLAFPREARPSACKPSPFLTTARSSCDSHQRLLPQRVRGEMETSVVVIIRGAAGIMWVPGN